MFVTSKVMVLVAIVIASLLYWATSNVCRYNFTIDLISIPKDRGFQYAAPDGNVTSDEISENEFFN